MLPLLCVILLHELSVMCAVCFPFGVRWEIAGVEFVARDSLTGLVFAIGALYFVIINIL